MSMKLKLSYTEEAEAQRLLALLKPVLPLFKLKKCAGTPPYSLIYLTPKKPEKPGK
jgi:hypothetical protein